MKRVLTYTSFIVTSLLVILAFITATTYTQLGIAVALYPCVAILAYRFFIVRNKKNTNLTVPERISKTAKEEIDPIITKTKKGDIKVADIDRRAFLKIIGASGLSFFLLSLINRKLGTPLFGGSKEPGISTLTDNEGTTISPAERQPTDGFTIAEIDDVNDVYYGFINRYGAWFIMKENDDGSFRYTKGEDHFADNWEDRDSLNYDYYHHVF